MNYLFEVVHCVIFVYGVSKFCIIFAYGVSRIKNESTLWFIKNLCVIHIYMSSMVYRNNKWVY